MSLVKKIGFTLVVFLFGFGPVLAAPQYTYQHTFLPSVTDYFELGTTTNEWLRVFSKYASTTQLTSTSLCLTGDSCITTWPSGSGGGSWATSSEAYYWSQFQPFYYTGGLASFLAPTTTVGLQIGGSTYLATSTGTKVGIATTSPWALFSVNANGLTGPEFAIGSSTRTDFQVSNGGQTLVQSGTSALPAYSFISSATDGFYSQSVGRLGVAIGAAGSIAFEANGKIDGAQNFNNYISIDQNGGISLVGSGTNQSITVTPSGTGAGVLSTSNIDAFWNISSSHVTGAAWLKFLTQSQGVNSRNWSFSTNQTATGDFELNESASASGAPTTPILTVTNTANFGIGSTTPWAQFSLNPNGITGPAFAIGSSTKTLLQVDNGGYTTISPTKVSTSISSAALSLVPPSSAAGNAYIYFGASPTGGTTGGIIESSQTTGISLIDRDTSPRITLQRSGSIIAGNATVVNYNNSANVDVALTVTPAIPNSATVSYGGENPTFVVNGAATQRISSSFATQNFSKFLQSTITATTTNNSITATTSTLYIQGAPIIAGSATSSLNAALYIDNTNPITTGATNAYGLYAVAPVGATNNYAAAFTGGNVGIGSSSPNFLLTVGSGSVGQLAVPTTGSVSVPQIQFGYNAGGTLGIYSDASNVIRFSVVGARALTVGASGMSSFMTSGFSSAAAPQFTMDAAATTGLFLPAAGTTGFSQAGTESMRITTAGLIGIASTTPWGQFSVNPSALGSGVPEFVVGSSTATHLIVTGGGSVGISTTTPGQSALLGVAGHVFSSGTVYANNFVDTSVTGSSCIGETSGLLGTSNCVSSLASAGGTLTISSPTGAVDASLNLAHGNVWTAASTTFTGNLSITGNSTTTNATTTTLAIGSQLVSAFKTPGFVYSTTTPWTASTTAFGLPSPFFPTKIDNVQCYTDTGTLNVDIYHTSTHLTLFNASTTQGVMTFSSNNTMTAGEKWYIVAGTPASSPTMITCAWKNEVTSY